MSKGLIALEIGHRANYPGAVYGNLRECDINLTAGLEFKIQVERHGFETYVNRVVWDGIPLTDFYANAAKKNPVAGVAFHVNAGGGNGFECDTQTNNMQSKSVALGNALVKKMEEITQLRPNAVRNFNTHPTPNGNNITKLINSIPAPFIYCECGFIDNAADRARFDTPEKQKQYGMQVAKGVLDYLGVLWVNEGDNPTPELPMPVVPDIPAHLRVDISSYDSFRAAVMGKYFDTDNSYGYQCYDGADLLWRNIGGKQPPNDPNGGNRRLRSDGSARGAFEILKYREFNAGTEFDVITDIKQIKRGDVIVYGTKLSSPYGHIGYADEDYSAGKSTIATLGQNQGGTGGVGQAAAFKVKSYPVSALVGAFRFKRWSGGASAFQPYRVRVNTDALNIRKGAGTGYDCVGVIRDKGVYTIVEEANGAGAGKWGKLKSGVGWVSLDWCVRM